MWNMVFANKTCNEFNRFKEHRDFLEKLSQTRHAIDTKAPVKPKFFANGAKKKVMKRETEREINYQNRILYNKMHELSTKPSPYSPCMNIPSRCPAFDRNAIDFKKRKNQRDITNCNQKLRKRFQSTKPTYNTKQMMKESSYNDYLKHNICNFTINPNIKYATYPQFKKNLTIAIERDNINPHYDSEHNVSCYTSINNNKENNNFSTISAVRPNSSKTYMQRTIEYTQPHSGKTRVTNSTIGNTTTVTK